VQKYSGGFEVNGKTDWDTVNWILSKTESNESKLLFQAYDANLWPLPDFSAWKDEEWKKKQIVRGLSFADGFLGEVWLDDVMLNLPPLIRLSELKWGIPASARPFLVFSTGLTSGRPTPTADIFRRRRVIAGLLF